MNHTDNVLLIRTKTATWQATMLVINDRQRQKCRGSSDRHNTASKILFCLRVSAFQAGQCTIDILSSSSPNFSRRKCVRELCLPSSWFGPPWIGKFYAKLTSSPPSRQSPQTPFFSPRPSLSHLCST